MLLYQPYSSLQTVVADAGVVEEEGGSPIDQLGKADVAGPGCNLVYEACRVQAAVPLALASGTESTPD